MLILDIFNVKNFSTKSFLLFIPAVTVGLLSLGVLSAKAATTTPALGTPSTTIFIGDKINITVSNTDAQHASTDIPVSFVGIKEGVAKVTACRQTTNCAAINITVLKKAAPKKVLFKKAAPKRVAIVKKVTPQKVVVKNTSNVSLTETQGLILSQDNITIRKQESADIFVQNSNAVTAVSDSSIVSASATSNPTLHNVKITLYGIATGVTNVKICDQNLVCANARVFVTASVSDGTLVLSQASVSVRNQESADIYVQNSNAVTAVSDSPVVSVAVNSNPTLNNVRITIYGVSPGTANVRICDQNLSCSTLRVVVSSYQVAYVPPTPVAPTPPPSIPVNSSIIGERYLYIPPGETRWVSMGNFNDLRVESNVWLVRATTKNNYLIISVTTYFEGEAVLEVCNGSGRSVCGLIHVNAKVKPPNLSPEGFLM